jgi:hypothetical protein
MFKKEVAAHARAARAAKWTVSNPKTETLDSDSDSDSDSDCGYEGGVDYESMIALTVNMSRNQKTIAYL